MDSMDSQQRRHIIIVGGGIIGCTTAYFLTRHPAFNPALHTVTVLEASAIAAGASGKAGGLLALWAYPECLVPLSYRLHAELAREHNGAERWGYRRLGCGSITAVVTAKDLEKPRPGAIIPGVVANGSVNGNGDYKDSAPQEPQPTINGNGNDTSAPQPGEPQPAQPAQPSGALPIQSVNPDRQRDFAPFADEKQETPPQQEKEWEKLPKQSASATALLSDSPLPPDLDWINRSLVTDYSEMGLGRGPSSTETAQVHPYHFTTSMAQLARERGVNFVIGAKVIKINHSKTSVGSVEYEDRSTGGHRILSGATDVVVTAGPWTGRLLPKTKIEGLRAHSVVLAADVSPYAVFTDIALPADWAPEHRAAKGQRRKHRGNVDPEIYARPGGEVYACGEPDTSIPLPETADQVQTDEAQCDDLTAYIATVSPALAAAPVKAKQACYLPRHIRWDNKERDPLVGRTAVPGLWVAAGHTCWGIQNGPATGCLMAEMLLEGQARSADVEKLDPRKFKV